MFYQVLEERQFEKRASLVLSEIAYLEKAAARQDLTPMEKVAILKQLRQAKGKLDDLGHRAAAYGSTKLMQRGIDPFEFANEARGLGATSLNVGLTGGNPLVALGTGAALKGVRAAVKKNEGMLGKAVRKTDDALNEKHLGSFGAADQIEAVYNFKVNLPGVGNVPLRLTPETLGSAIINTASGAF